MTNSLFKGVKPLFKYKPYVISITIIVLIVCVVLQQAKILSQNKLLSNSKINKNISPLLTNRTNDVENDKNYAIRFPQIPYITEEGTARIKNPYSYDFFTNKNFILMLALTSETTKEYDYPISLKGSVDGVSNLSVAPGHKHGCVTLQTSGYVGSYVFDIESGKGIYQGPQYSRCVEWISPNKVIMSENIYNTKTVTYYVFNTVNQAKIAISDYQVNSN